MAEYLNDQLDINNIAGHVYTISKLEVVDPETKAQELTNLLRLLLSVGIYESIESAFYKGVPPGTFVVIDDPATPEAEFNVQIVKEFTRKEALPDGGERV
jgi:hypothetical protein